MPEHLSDGKFAPKEVTDSANLAGTSKRRGRFKKGDPKPPNSGRKKGTPNKITRAVEEFLADLCTDAEVQESVRDRIKRGDNVAFFRALEHFKGKPREQVDAKLSGELLIGWKGGD